MIEIAARKAEEYGFVDFVMTYYDPYSGYVITQRSQHGVYTELDRRLPNPGEGMDFILYPVENKSNMRQSHRKNKKSSKGSALIELAERLLEQDNDRTCVFCSKSVFGWSAHDVGCPFALAYKAVGRVKRETIRDVAEEDIPF